MYIYHSIIFYENKNLCSNSYFLFFQIVSFAQNTEMIYSKIYFEANEKQFEKLRNEIVFEHLAREGKGYIGDFDQNEKK